jgi:hypothetical protein
LPATSRVCSQASHNIGRTRGSLRRNTLKSATNSCNWYRSAGRLHLSQGDRSWGTCLTNSMLGTVP